MIKINKDCNQPCEDIKKLKNKVESNSNKIKNQEDRLCKAEKNIDENIDSVHQLSVTLSEYKTIAHNIIEKIDNLENRLFSYLTTVTKNASKEEEDWKNLIKWVIGATVVALIGYIFGRGGLG